MNTAQENFKLQRWISLLSVVLFIAKLIAYYLTHSMAILTDALESIVNVIAGFIGLYSLYVAASVGLKRVEKIDDTKSTVKTKTSNYKKMDFSFDKIGKDMNTQIKNSFINTLEYLQSNQVIKSSEDYLVFVRGILEGLKEKIQFERNMSIYEIGCFI